MTPFAPKLRSDVIVSQHETAGGTFFVVKEPASGNFFRLREAEHFIVQQFDGETPIEVVRQRVEEKFDAKLSVDTLDVFIKNLEKTGLLESGNGKKKERTVQHSRIRDNVLYFRFKVFDPARFFDRLAPRMGFFFTPHFVVLSAALILLALGIMVTDWNDFVPDLSRLYRLSAIPVLMGIVFLVLAAHEFAHGLTCRHFGGEVHEIGFMLIYFQPALYCNVSDAWLFPEKSKRLWVGFAGPYFELFLWALAVLAWRLSDPETWINYVALIVMATSGIKTLLNFNPLIKLDGYYMLSDYLEIPNLRKKSFRYVGGLLKKLVGLPSERAEAASWRERWVYLGYGLVASVGSFSLLVYVLAIAGGDLVEGHQPAVVLFSMGLLGAKFRRRFRRLFGKAAAASDPFDDFDDFDAPSGRLPAPAETGSSQIAAAKLEPEKSEPTGSKDSRLRGKGVRPVKRRTIWTALAGITLAVLFLGRAELRVAGPFNILPRENADVRAGVEGIIEQIYVDEGDKVEEGDLIARLSDRFQRSELQKIDSELESKRARLRLLMAGTRPEEIELARKTVETSNTKQQHAMDFYTQAQRARAERLSLIETTIKKAEERLQFGEKNLQMQQTLMQQGLGSGQQLDAAAEQVAIRKRELEEARAHRQVLQAEDLAEIRKDVAVTEKEAKEAEGRLKVILAGTRREEIQALQAEIKRSEAEQALIREQLDGTQIMSPAAGVVATPSRVLKEMNRQLVKRGDLIAKVYDFKIVTAQIIISEKEIAGVQVGQKVELRARAYPSESFNGTVTSIATSAQGSSSAGEPTLVGTSPGTAASGTKTIVVTTQIENHSLLLKPEMTGQAKIFCGRRRISDLVTRRAARTFKVEFWSWW